MKSSLYYEAHVTIQPPITEGHKKHLESICERAGFKLATFQMYKDETKKPEAFTSARDKDYRVMQQRLCNFCERLKAHHFVILRYKIEDTLLDSKFEGDLLEVYRRDEIGVAAMITGKLGGQYGT